MQVHMKLRTITVSLIVMIGLLIPRILRYFLGDIGIINILTEPYATFIIVLIAVLLFLYPWLKEPKYFIFLLIIAVLVSIGLPLYFCKLPLPW